MRYKLASLIILIFIFVLNLSANEHESIEHHKESTDLFKQKVDYTIINNDNIVMKNDIALEDKTSKINYLEEAYEYFHNILVHFLYTLPLLSFLYKVFSLKCKQIEFSIKYIVLIATIFSIPTFITGLYQAGYFIGDPKEVIVGIHKILAILPLSILWIWSIFLMAKPLKSFTWIIAIICFILTTATWFFGGIKTHKQGLN